MIVPTIKDAVADNPGITYQCIREIMKPYAKEYTLTDSIVQDGKNLAKQELFGDPDDNVIYARPICGHWDTPLNLYFTTDVKRCK